MPDYESRRQANADEGYERARITIADIEALTDGPLEAVPPVVVRTLAMQLLDAEAETADLRARLAKAERERDEWHACARRNFDRLAEVEKVCTDEVERVVAYGEARVPEWVGKVRAAARGEGDPAPMGKCEMGPKHNGYDAPHWEGDRG